MFHPYMKGGSDTGRLVKRDRTLHCPVAGLRVRGEGPCHCDHQKPPLNRVSPRGGITLLTTRALVY